MSEQPIDRCGFCGQPSHKVGPLVQGETAFICRSCIEGCWSELGLPQQSENTCSFCTNKSPLVGPLVQGNGLGEDHSVYICTACLTGGWKAISERLGILDPLPHGISLPTSPDSDEHPNEAPRCWPHPQPSKEMLDDYSESLTEDHARNLARHTGALQLHRIVSLDVDSAKALVRHKGQFLSLPSVRLLTKEVAETLATYNGRLMLDGLWMVDSVPLAKALSRRWLKNIDNFPYPNLSVSVAEAINKWPEPSKMWPPGMTGAEGAKGLGGSDGWRSVTDPENARVPSWRITSGVSVEETRAIKEWLHYSEQRHTRLQAFLDEQNTRGYGLSIAEAPYKERSPIGNTPLSELAKYETMFCTRFWITDVRHAPVLLAWFYINTDNKCIGPLTREQFDSAKDKSDPCLYWMKALPMGTPMYMVFDKLTELNNPEADSDNPRISDIRIKRAADSCVPWRAQAAGLACLQAAERLLPEVRDTSLFEWKYDFEVDFVCKHYQRIDSLMALGVDLCPQLEHIPNVDRFRGRAICIEFLEELLMDQSDEDSELRPHIKKWIRRLRK